MAISFPNQSRSYDAKRHCVRFWGHDESREVSFLIEEDALWELNKTTTHDEDGLLNIFDSNRERIFGVARKVYSRRGSGFYTLAASNF